MTHGKGVAMMAIPLALAFAACDFQSAAEIPVPQTEPLEFAAGSSLSCTPIKLWDGDGPIHCAEGPKIRLAGIAAREVRWTGKEMVDAGCNEGHPCPTKSGVEAREHLAGLLSAKRRPGTVLPTGHTAIEGPKLTCTSNGSAGGKRTAAWCVSPLHGDLSCAMVKAGYALRWDRYWRDRRC